MLDDLVKVIETLQQRMRSHGATLRENEIRTRMALIDALLQALGWDTADPATVRPEYDVSRLRVDYALLRLDGNPAAVVEAKKLGESLEPHRMQMLNYANASAIRYAGLSDGDRWEWIALSEFVPESKTAPTAIRFPGEVEEQSIRWWELIYRTADWLLRMGHLTQEMSPVSVGPNTHLINDTGVHPNGNPFVPPRLLETEKTKLFVFTAFGRQQTVNHTRHLLEHCGQNPAEVFVRVGNPA